jgi:hypothetical protein
LPPSPLLLLFFVFYFLWIFRVCALLVVNWSDLECFLDLEEQKAGASFRSGWGCGVAERSEPPWKRFYATHVTN